jgi:hypothetical protein
MRKPRILIVDIETSPLISYTWGTFQQDVPINQIVEDWHLLSFSAKFIGESKIFYLDQRNAKDIRNDKPLLKKLWDLLDEADLVVGQNLDAFDVKRINTRFIVHEMQPPSSYRTIDTLKMARKSFGFTSNKLEFLSNKLNNTHKKSKHKRYSGFELWKECLAGNLEAWKEMESYNKKDILATEELFKKLQPWSKIPDINAYHDDSKYVCICGSVDFVKRGFHFTNNGKYQRYTCNKCGKQSHSKTNLLTKEKRKSLRS